MPSNGEMKAMTDEKRLSKLDIDGVKARMVTIRGQLTLLDRFKPRTGNERNADNETVKRS